MKFTTKKMAIDAFQWKIGQAVFPRGFELMHASVIGDNLVVEVAEGHDIVPYRFSAHPDDWIIKDDKNRFYALNKIIFSRFFERVVPESKK